VSLHYIIRIAHNLQAFPTSCTSLDSSRQATQCINYLAATLLGNLLGGHGKPKAATSSLYAGLQRENTMMHAVRNIGSEITASKTDMESTEDSASGLSKAEAQKELRRTLRFSKSPWWCTDLVELIFKVH